ncbi:MFS family permease [Sphingomonas insulae]|uniref:MFS transporter n=1 Tax=Sphingomonas insulae TaxID=424800 RepID=UPI0013D41B7D|nr:MFS transporter [Sphingomonas insulae]NIJ29660.1 MFS family permease [Sphingomonas insulae]
MHAIPPGQDRLPVVRVLLYGLASAGGVIGYLPLLTLLLPMKLASFPEDMRYGVLAVCGVVGAIVAGGANIAFGWLGDRSVARGGGRRHWMVSGTIATVLAFAAIVVARAPAAIVAAIVLFQIAINAVLAQVASLIAEEVPAAQKGTAAALSTLGNPFAAGASAIVVAAAATQGWRLAIVAVLMTGCLLPLMLAGTQRIVSSDPAAPARTAMRRDLIVAWAARLLMQIANCGVGLYLFFYFERFGRVGDDMAIPVARLLFVATIVPVPLALALGRWSDRIARRRPFLAATAVLATLGLAGMAVAASWTIAAVAYVAFASGVAAFIALNTGHAMLLLSDGTRRGRDLGLLNLANTLPQVVAPLLAWGSGPAHGFGTALSIMAAMTLLAGILPLVAGGDTGRG